MTIRVFASGQSNALGRGSGGPDWSTIDSRVRVWNNVNPLGSNGSAFVSAASARAGGTFDQSNRNNFAVWFCDRLARYADDDVDMTIVARGASAIIEWAPEGYTYPMLQECIDVWAATGQPPADVFLWHQGEGNTTSPEGVWSAGFSALLTNLAAGGVIDSDTTIIVGGLSEQVLPAKVVFNNTVLKPLEAQGIRFARANGLATTDGTHFDGPALYRFGAERYFHAYLKGTTRVYLRPGE